MHAAAQSIRGTVVDAQTLRALSAADVVVRDTAGNAVAAADADDTGGFHAALPAAGTYLLTARHIGYLEVTSAPLTILRGEAVTLDVRLSPAAVPLEPVVVVARRFPDSPGLRDFYERADAHAAAGRGRVMMREEIEAYGGAFASSLVHDLYPAPLGPPAGCEPRIFVDGLRVPGLPELDAVIQPSDIEGIEVYREPTHIPARYQLARSQGDCGVVLVWRRPYGADGRAFSWERVVVVASALFALVMLLR